MSAPVEVVRLSVNLAPGVAAVLKQMAARDGVTITEQIRRCIALAKLLEDERDEGNRITVVSGRGQDAIFRDLVWNEEKR